MTCGCGKSLPSRGEGHAQPHLVRDRGAPLMPRIDTLLFDSPGPQNTEATLQAALRRARQIGITQFVVASSSGRTAVRAGELLTGQGRVIAVTLAAAHWGEWARPDPALLAEAQRLGVRVLTAPHAFGGLNFVFEREGDLPPPRVIAYTLWTFCQGMKVCVECALMAADAGLLDMQREVVSIAGTARGADTAVVLRPAYSRCALDLRVREVLAKPR